MRSSIVYVLAITTALGADAPARAQRPGGVTSSAPAGPASKPQTIAPGSDHPVARRTAELVQIIGTADEAAKTAFVSSAWNLRENETVGSVVKDLGSLPFLLGKDLKVTSIDLNADGTAAMKVVNAYGRNSIVGLNVEHEAPYHISIAWLERTPLDVPKELREPRSVSLGSSIVSAPLTFHGVRPMVDVMIGNKGPYRFMLETGADVVMISPQVAAAIPKHLTPLTPDVMWQAEGQELGSTYIMQQLSIGDATLDQLGIMVVPMRPGEDGVLGLSAYRNLLLGIDIANKTMTLQEGTLPAPDGKEILALRPLGPLWAVDVGAGDTVVLFEIDTQADNSFFLATELSGGWEFEDELVQVGTVVTAGGQHRSPSMLGRFSGDLVLGKYSFQKPLIRVRADPEDLIPPSGILGVRALEHFTITLDQRNQRVRFARQGPPVIAPPPSYRSLDFDIFTGRDGKPKIVDLDPQGTSAKAGLREGDEVVTFADLPGKEAAGNVRRLAQTAEPIVVEVFRDNQPITVTVQSELLVK